MPSSLSSSHHHHITTTIIITGGAFGHTGPRVKTFQIRFHWRPPFSSPIPRWRCNASKSRRSMWWCFKRSTARSREHYWNYDYLPGTLTTVQLWLYTWSLYTSLIITIFVKFHWIRENSTDLFELCGIKKNFACFLLPPQNTNLMGELTATTHPHAWPGGACARFSLHQLVPTVPQMQAVEVGTLKAQKHLLRPVGWQKLGWFVWGDSEGGEVVDSLGR